MNSKVAGVVMIVIAALVGGLSLLWPLRPQITPGGRTIDIEEREVLTAVPERYAPETARFTVKFNDIVNPYRVLGVYVMPSEKAAIEVVSRNPDASYDIEAAGGTATPNGDAKWVWQAPEEPGHYAIHVDETTTGFSLTMNAFVMQPYSLTQEKLNGYMIGTYESVPLKGDSAYLPPKGFIEVTPQTEQVLVSPHFTLGQFLCKQVSGYPKYLALQERLLIKLEVLLAEMNALGFESPSLHVMSAYRTPHYNKMIGNETSYSQHLYGGAADVFIDIDDDDHMDDLDDDGEITRKDAVYMAQVVETRIEPTFKPLIGGLGIYSPAPHRGPFIHVDVRGKPVRW